MNFVVKRCMDILLSMIAIILLSPILLIILLAVRFDSKGPAVFKQTRLKKDGKAFTMYKFRTMIENAENIGTGLFNYKDDFRVTKIGKLLRRSSLDELPQLFNILKGDMSIVGPRPPVFYELGDFNNLNGEYKRRFLVSPGITGLAQVNGRNELPWDQKIKYDNQYIDLFTKYGILIDIKIIVLTVINVFRMKDIYEVKDEYAEGMTDEELAIKAAEAVMSKTHISNQQNSINI